VKEDHWLLFFIGVVIGWAWNLAHVHYRGQIRHGEWMWLYHGTVFCVTKTASPFPLCR